MRRTMLLLATVTAVVPPAVRVQAPSAAKILAGCWIEQQGDRVVEETWTGLRAGVMLGMARTVVKGRMVEQEFVVLRHAGEHLEYAVRLGDQPTVLFTSTRLNASEVVFENPTHDFPKRVGYARTGPDALEAWVDGGSGSAGPRVTYRYRRGACGAS